MEKMRKASASLLNRTLLIFWCMLLSLSAYAQNFVASGIVTDAKNEPLIGVTVFEKGTNNGTVTDVDGKFTLHTRSNAVLSFSYVGYVSQELKATSRMKVVLNEDNQLLNEVVVIGYGTMQRRDVTTAISSVSTKDLAERPLTSAAQAIQGKVAGVSVIQPSGMPGGELAIRVRGTTSFNGSNDPLYVVDGVPVDKIDFLSPNDIESMQIMKDASSAAIYGSRAANGVILITTKSGKNGEAKVTFNAQYGIDRVINNIEVLNTQQYLELQKELGNTSLPANLTDQTDWFKEAYQTGVTQSYQASVSDGNDRMRYMVSGGYLNQKGVLDAAFFNRYNLRGSIDGDVRKWLHVSANLTYSNSERNDLITGQGSNRGGVVLSVINTPTYAPIWNPDKPEQYYDNFYGANITSPMENMQRSRDNRIKEDRLLLSGSALFKILPGLNFKTTYSFDRRNGLTTNFLDPVSTGWGRQHFGIGADNRNRNTVTTFDNVLTYETKFGKHAVEAMIGTSHTASEYLNSWINGTNYRSSDIHTLNAANKIDWYNTGTGGSEWAIMSYMGRVAYNFDSRYLLTMNIRRDGSSRLHPDSRWGTFPSFSAGWRISSEEFMKGLTWLDDLKLRAGWGKTGNQSGINDYAYLQRYNIVRLQWFGEKGDDKALPTITPANLRSNELKWETTTQTNVGVDFTALSNRLTISLDYYFKRTTDMLMNVSMPATGASSVTSIQRNEGEMENQGFELSLSSKNLKGAFSWDTDFNLSINRNKLTKLSYTPIYEDAKTNDHVNAFVVRNQPGRPLGSFYGYIADGVDRETGELIYRDLDGNGIGGTPGDQTFIGDPNPDFTYGLTNTFSWKNFNLVVFIQGTYGNDVYNASRMETEGMYDARNQTTAVLDRWKIPGQITDVPKAGFNMKNSTYFLEDGSYMRLKSLTLSYNFKNQFLKKIGVTRLQPYFTANNLLTLTSYKGMDPEVNQWGNSGAVQGIDWGTYPQTKTFVFGVNVEF